MVKNPAFSTIFNSISDLLCITDTYIFCIMNLNITVLFDDSSIEFRQHCGESPFQNIYLQNSNILHVQDFCIENARINVVHATLPN